MNMVRKIQIRINKDTKILDKIRICNRFMIKEKRWLMGVAPDFHDITYLECEICNCHELAHVKIWSRFVWKFNSEEDALISV